MDKWDNRYLRLAKEVSTWSKDPSTKVGAVAVLNGSVLAQGYNGFPRYILDDPEPVSYTHLTLPTIYSV